MTPLKILAGTMMMREGMLLPESAQVESCPYSKDWRALIGVDSFAFDQKLSGTGLRLFFLAGELKVLEFGWGPSAVRRAINRVFSRLRKLDVNCMQVAEIKPIKVLGLPCVAIHADLFHIQSGPYLQSKAQRRSD
ncbi:MAG TPA: hypothetical protein VFP59_02485 [Candidatus Angelobacter sp.]|nr:hypothetical protein [Candidatus Angelobacter sp.]